MTDAEPLFLTLAEVLEIHADQLRLFGGSDGIRDQGALESAIAMAAAYAFHIAQNQWLGGQRPHWVALRRHDRLRRR